MTKNLKEFVNHIPDLGVKGESYGPEHVVILLAHFNAGPHLSEQLQSLTTQSHRDWSLIISDDGSCDGWLETVAEFARSDASRRVWLACGPGRGFAQNFLSLIGRVGPTAPYAAFCDQDDVWMPGKLNRALHALSQAKPGTPALYCGRTLVCDAALTPAGPSPLFDRPTCFANALVQNVGGGNTMVLNRAALDLVQDTAQHATGIVSHDWWCYQIVSGAGGLVIYDPEPAIFYRQHGANAVGANRSGRARMARLRRLLAGEFRDWNARHSAALARAQHWLTPQARATLAVFDIARTGALHRRLPALVRSGVYRQTRRGQLALWLAALLKRL